MQVEDLCTLFSTSVQDSSSEWIWLYLSEIVPFKDAVGLKKLSKGVPLGRLGNSGNDKTADL